VDDWLERALEGAHAAADGAAEISTRGLGHAQKIDRKQSGIDLVTEYDLEVERSVVSLLGARFPDDAVVGEEATADRASGARRWYVDPIDGTTNFAHGLSHYCTSIALVDELGPAVAVVDAPALGWRYWAVRGHGASAYQRGDARPRPIRVSATAALDGALLATGFPYDLRTSADDNVRQFAAMQRAAQAVRRFGSAALDLCWVGTGAFDGYWEQKLKPWDVAAGILIVLEAGGRVTGYDGRPADLEQGRLVASNGRIHDALLAALANA
jgi:myo-inositol-1(or 4)-monophosphatase